jgi:hypothetical protein
MGKLSGKVFIPVQVNLMPKFLPSEPQEKKLVALQFMSASNPVTITDALLPVPKA